MKPLKFLITTLLLVCCASFLISGVSNAPLEGSSDEKPLVHNTPTLPNPIPSAGAIEYAEKKKQLQTAVQAYFDKAIRRGAIVGAAVSITQGDSILLATGFGKRKVSSSEKVDQETVFRLGSLSKGFAGVLTGKLKSDGLLDWDDKVSHYVPEFTFQDQQFTQKITLSHILSHSSGAPYHSYTDLIEDGVALKDIASKFKSVKPISEPGELYSYQNAMFALSGAVTECITGNTINQDLERYFFTPLAMNSTSTDHQDLMASDNKAYPHKKYRGGWRATRLTDNYYNAVPAGGINASVGDMAKWMRFLLGHNESIMTTEALKEVFSPVIKHGGRSKYYQRWEGHLSSYYGYGWRIHTFADAAETSTQTMIHHGGSVNNFRNEIALFPEEDLGICVLMNSMTRIAKHVIPDLHQIVAEIYNLETHLPVELAAN